MRLFVGVLACALLASVAACGGGNGKNETSVRVTLSEWAIDVSPATMPEGTAAISLVNEGSLTHNLVIAKSDLPAGQLPLADGRVDLSRLNVEGEAGPIAPGARADSDAAYALDLTPGKYVMFCDVVADGESHYENGMYAPLLVEP